MIVYKFKHKETESELCVNDDGPAVMECDTDETDAYFFVKFVLETGIKQHLDNNLKNKKILDVGMGNGNVLKCVREQFDADVFGIDISNYLYSDNYQKDRTFVNMDVCDLPKEWLGTFDVVYQRLFSVPFKDTLNVLSAISKAIKPDGMYLVTFDDEEYEHKESFVIKILKELYDNVEVKEVNNLVKCCVASKPRINPKLTPMNEYYYTLSDEEYAAYRVAGNEERREILSTKK